MSRIITPTVARRLAITRQHLAGPKPASTRAAMLETVRDIAYLQLDPISAVARSHLLVLWSRLGKYDPKHLDSLLWKDRQLFEYWAHAAAIVLAEDFPIHQILMRTYGADDSGWGGRIRAWMEENQSLHDHVLDRLRTEGPLMSRQFEDKATTRWGSMGWTAGHNVSRMLDFLWLKGKIVVAGRSGGQKVWDLTERCFPYWTSHDPIPERDVQRAAAQKSLRALGVAPAAHIKAHFTNNRYGDPESLLGDLEAEGKIEAIEITGDGQTWPGKWYVHTDDLPLLEGLSNGAWEPRTRLLSPFDNLIGNRTRTDLMFDFYFRIEIYTPKVKRQYGYYVLPILHGDQLIGRIDPTMDRKHKRLTINAVYAEPNAPKNAGKTIASTIEELGGFLGANEIVYSDQVPGMWKRSLQ